MAIFDQSNLDYRQRVDYKLLRNAPVNHFIDIEVLRRVCDDLVHYRYHIDTLDCQTWHAKDDFHDAISETLQFSYYGRNLDALNDCMATWSSTIPLVGGAVLVLLHFDLFAHLENQFAISVLDIFANWSRQSLLFGKAFILLVHTSDPHFSTPPLGGIPLMINPYGWRRKDGATPWNRLTS